MLKFWIPGAQCIFCWSLNGMSCKIWMSCTLGLMWSCERRLILSSLCRRARAEASPCLFELLCSLWPSESAWAIQTRWFLSSVSPKCFAEKLVRNGPRKAATTSLLQKAEPLVRVPVLLFFVDSIVWSIYSLYRLRAFFFLLFSTMSQLSRSFFTNSYM